MFTILTMVTIEYVSVDMTFWLIR